MHSNFQQVARWQPGQRRLGWIATDSFRVTIQGALALLCLWTTVRADERPEPALVEYERQWGGLVKRINQYYNGPVIRALSYPFEGKAEETGRGIDLLLSEVSALSKPAALPPVAEADRINRLAFLQWLKVRLLSEMQRGRQNLDTSKERIALSEDVVRNADAALRWIEMARTQEPSSPGSEWIARSRIADHTWTLKAQAHAILWSLGVEKTKNRSAARAAWYSVSSLYASQYPPATDELEKIVMPYLQDPSNIPHAMLLGIGMLLVGLILVFAFKKKPNPIQIWVLRAFICIGAGLAASGIHGNLHLEYNGWISAGGAMGVVVLFYLVNPPALVPAEPNKP